MKLSRLSIPYRSLRGLGVGFMAIFFSTGSFMSGRFEYAVLILLLLFLGVVVTFGWEYLVWRNFEYVVTGDSVEIRHGVLRKNVRDIPLRRVQNVDIRRSIFLRLLGIAQVNFETAGGRQTEASLRYVSLEQAKDVQRKVRRLKQGLEEEEESSEELLFEMDFSDLVVLGLVSFNLRSALGVFVLLSVAGGVIGSVIESANVAASVVVAGMAVALALSVWLGGAVNAIVKYFDFRLVRADEALEYERGLLNRSSGSIPFEKIQSLTVEDNPLKRLFGYSTLKIETAGYAVETANEKGSEAAIPLASTGGVMRMVEELYNVSSLDIEKVPSRARRRYMARYGIVSVLLAAAGYLVNAFAFRVPYLYLLLLIPVSAVAAHYKYVHRGFALLEDYFAVRNGFWRRRTMIVPFYRIQNLIRSETVFQRRWGLATLTLDTAGGSLISEGNAKAVDMDAGNSREIASQVFERFRESV